MTTNVPTLKFTEKGIVAPLEADILNARLDDLNTAFGGGLNRNLDTPQGQIASSDAAIIADKNNFFIKLVNQINPDYAEGMMQDAIAKIYFLERKKATSSVVTCKLTGLAGTIVPSGFKVKDGSGFIWSLSYSTQIPDAGFVYAQFQCTQAGTIQAKAGTITEIYQAIVGLDRIENEVDATPGQEEESRRDFAFRRQNSVALNSVGTPQAVYANVFAVKNVSDVFVYHNVKDEPVQYGVTECTIAPHSIYVAAVGGSNQEIAQAIWERAGNGCNYNGNTTVKVYDMTYSEPRPEYKISFNRPELKQVFVDVLIEQNSNSSVGMEQRIKEIIINAFTGADGLDRCRIAGRVRAARFINAIKVNLPDIDLLGVQVGLKADELKDFINLGIDQAPAISEHNITIRFETQP